MKQHGGVLRRAGAVFFALLLTFLLPAAALADAWIPPDDDYAFYLMTSAGNRVVSLFISNYTETGLGSYPAGTSASTLAATVLKHFELNASQFKDGVSYGTDRAGQQYLRVTAEKFEQRARALFPNSSLRASDCVGYGDGAITVTADHVNGPIDLVSTVDTVNYQGGHQYFFMFTVWRVDMGSVSAVYGATDEAPTSKLTKVTTGRGNFEYYGDADSTEISTWELELLDFSVDGSLSGATSVLSGNRAYAPDGLTAEKPVAALTTAAITSVTAEETAPEETEATRADETTEVVKGAASNALGGKTDTTVPGSTKNNNRTAIYIVIVLAVAIIVLLAVLIIVVVLKKH